MPPVYRMYEAEASQIKSRGESCAALSSTTSSRRVIYAALANARSLPRLEYAKAPEGSCPANGLQVLKGEFHSRPATGIRDGGGDLTKVDLELATPTTTVLTRSRRSEPVSKLYPIALRRCGQCTPERAAEVRCRRPA